jgi:microcystin-dependent protein
VAVKIRRTYKGAAVSAVLDSSGVTSATQTSITLSTSPSTWPTGKFFAVFAPGTAQEEKMCVTVSGATLTVVDPAVSSTSASANGRGVDNTTARSTIAGGATVYPVFTAVDADEANELTSTYSAQGHLVYQGASTFTGLGIGTAGQVLKVNSGATAPEWGQVAAAGIASDAVITAKILDANVTLAKLATVLQNALPPVGTIVSYGGSSAPTGWLLCDGSTFNATTYSSLNTVLGGNTLPDFRARVPMGKAASGTGSTLLGTGGDRKIGSTHLPTHAHALDHDHASFNFTHDHASFSVTSGGHTHTVSGSITGTTQEATQGFAGTGAAAGFMTNTNIDAVTSTANLSSHTHSFSLSADSNTHSHDIDVPSNTTAIDIPAFTGTVTTTFANDDYFQPFVAVNYIIKHDYV